MNTLKTITKKGLTVKLTLTTTILTIIIVLVLGSFFVIQQQAQIYSDLRKRGLSLAKSTAHNCVYGVIISDEEILLRNIKSIESEDDVAYVIIQDLVGNVLAQTNTGIESEAVGQDINKQAIKVEKPHVFPWKPKSKSQVYDIVVPVISTSEMSEPAIELDMLMESEEDLFATEEVSAPTKPSAEEKIGVVRLGMTLQTAETTIQRSILITVLLTIVLMTLSILATSRIVKTILKPLQQLLLTAQAIGKGDLTAKIVEPGKDEIGQLAFAFKKMQDNLQNMVRQIRSSAELIDASVSELSSSSRQQATGANEQSTSLTETSSTIEELAAVSKQIAENARKVAELAEQNLSGMETIRANTTQGANRILTLGEKSQRIGEVVAIIDDIAKQTNLLALNASIEAARAGEAGKGFAVVAVEIRKLATNVANSTKQIRETIKEIQNATNASVLATENVDKSVEKGIELSKVTADSANQISMATQQQKSAAEQMVTTIKEMVTIAQQTSAGSTQIAETAKKLSETTREQAKLVEQFKIEKVSHEETR